MYEYYIKLVKKSGLVFNYLVLDEIYTFTEKKSKKCYIWTCVGQTITGRKFYFYHLSKRKNIDSLIDFNLKLPKANFYFSDGNFAYENVYGKNIITQKSKMTNLVENLNSQIRDKISYLVRRTKAHSKSFSWLNDRLSMFFVNLT